jgi:hypothetical protein
MERRTFITTTGALSLSAIAGCIGGNAEPSAEILADPPEGITVSDIDASTDSNELTGDGLVVTGVLENTGSETARIPLIEAVFYDADDVRLGESNNLIQSTDPIASGEKVQFQIFYFGDPAEVARYTLTFSGSTSTSGSTAASAGTETPTRTETSTPEPVSESFFDGFETGDIRTSTRWSLDLQDKVATQPKEADAQIVSESAPDGGSGSLSISVLNGGRAVITSSEQYRWDAPWLVEGMFKPQVRDSRFAYTRIGLYGGEVLLDMAFNTTSVGIQGRNEQVTPVQEDIGEWKDNVWYAYDCEYDGESRYLLTVWEASESRPTSPTAVTTGRPLNDSELPLMIRAYAGGDVTVNHAFIGYQAGESME